MDAEARAAQRPDGAEALEDHPQCGLQRRRTSSRSVVMEKLTRSAVFSLAAEQFQSRKTSGERVCNVKILGRRVDEGGQNGRHGTLLSLGRLIGIGERRAIDALRRTQRALEQLCGVGLERGVLAPMAPILQA
ncbi:MAG: hypothetical protein R2748_05020 [Bryobacterales bacterium]